MTDAELDRAVRALGHGDAIGFPTETVYGLGADAGNPAAVRRVFELKGRPAAHPLIVHLAAAAELENWTRRVPEPARRLAARFWPGPLTLILPRAPGVLDEVTGGQESVGIRVPRHPLARRLLEAFGGGIAAPSANRYGRVSPTTAQHVRDEFGAQVPVVLDGGPCEVGLESTIVSCLGELLLLRPGGIPASALEAEIGPLRRARQGEGPRAPGTTVAHYAPVTPLRALEGAAFEAACRVPGVAVLARSPGPADFAGCLWIEAPRDAEAYGHDLYANLRRLDGAGAKSIVLERVPGGGGWEAVRDRLERAAAACDAEELA
jgi:L-threonylcarbamoyladenylate synthase